MIKFNVHYVQDIASKEKCRVYYSLNNRRDGRECVTLYAKGYCDHLTMFANRTNNSDSMTDYFETDRVVIFKDDPLYPAALEAAKKQLNRPRRKR